MATANENYLDAQIRHQIYLTRYSGSVRNRMNALLDRVEGDLEEKIMRLSATAEGLSSPRAWNNLYKLQEAVNTIRSGAWDQVYAELSVEMVELAKLESTSLDQLIKLVLPVLVDTVAPPVPMLRSIALSRPFQGRVLKDWVATMESNDIAIINNAIKQGMAASETNKQILRRVIGSAAANGADGITEMTRTQVNNIVRTAVQHVANNTRNEYYNENSDIVNVEQVVATLDARTTAVCRGYDGKRFPLNKGPQFPIHIGCRTLRVAALDATFTGERPAKPTTEKMMLKEFAEKNDLGEIKNYDQLPRGKKGEFNKYQRTRVRELTGPVPAAETYNTWLRKQPVDFQDEVLGKTKAKLYRDGKLDLDRFTNRTGDELTLSELAKKEKTAFKLAGLDPDDY